jgi:hypothetical protein
VALFVNIPHRREPWPVRAPHQVPDARRGSAPKDTLRGATQRISTPERMEERSPATVVWDTIYHFTPRTVDEDEDPSLSYGSNSSSNSGSLISKTPMTSTPVFVIGDSFSTSTGMGYECPPLMIVDKDEDHFSPPLSYGSNSSSSITKTSMTSTSIFYDPFSTSTLPWLYLAIRD